MKKGNAAIIKKEKKSYHKRKFCYICKANLVMMIRNALTFEITVITGRSIETLLIILTMKKRKFYH